MHISRSSKWFIVIAVVALTLFSTMGAIAAPSPDSVPCSVPVREALGTVLPSGWSDVQACSALQSTNVIPVTGLDSKATIDRGQCLSNEHEALGTVLPSGWSDVQACSALQNIIR